MEIIPKESSKMSGWLVFLFYFSLALLAVFVIGYFRLNASIAKNQAILEKSEADLSTLHSPENLSLKKEILTYEKKINDYKTLIDGHKINSKVFKFLEDLVHPDVWFNSFNFQSESDALAVSGIAKSFDSLGQQLMILQKERRVRELVLESVFMNSEGNIEFNVSFSLDPGSSDIETSNEQI